MQIDNPNNYTEKEIFNLLIAKFPDNLVYQQDNTVNIETENFKFLIDKVNDNKLRIDWIGTNFVKVGNNGLSNFWALIIGSTIFAVFKVLTDTIVSFVVSMLFVVFISMLKGSPKMRLKEPTSTDLEQNKKLEILLKKVLTEKIDRLQPQK